jgi:lipoate---protein ligase
VWIDDQIMLRCEQALYTKIWQPSSRMVVLGRSNKVESECNKTYCDEHGVAILRRSGGGGTVLLGSGCAVISLGVWVRQYYQNAMYFDLINQSVVSCLADKWPQLTELKGSGISDLSYCDQKIAGTSMFRSRNYLLYQASILVNEDMEQIEQTLRHPSAEPEYREGRDHRQFLSQLGDIVQGLVATDVCAHLEGFFEIHLKKQMEKELIEVPRIQTQHILGKVKS